MNANRIRTDTTESGKPSIPGGGTSKWWDDAASAIAREFAAVRKKAIAQERAQWREAERERLEGKPRG